MNRNRKPRNMKYELSLNAMITDWLRWLAPLKDPVFGALDLLTAWFFDFGSGWAILRWFAITLVGAGLWVLLAIQPLEKLAGAIDPNLVFDQVFYVICQVRETIVALPPEEAAVHFCGAYANPEAISFEPLIFEIPLQWLFGAGVFRHILLLAFACWLAFKIASQYQADVYDIPDISCSEHFLLQAAFINPRNVINIQDASQRPLEEHLPLYLIGGPGKVCVHLENAALFEKMDGVPRVVGPTVRQSVILDGFERLRKVIDLRDQKESFDIRGRSQDGIRVAAKDVQVVYSVFRNHIEPSYEQPYPFQDPRAIENLVFQQSQQVWNLSVGIQIRGALLDFFAQHTLNEFLAMIQEPELKKAQEYELELMKESRRLSGSEEPIGTPPIENVDGIEYVSRPQITDLFYERAEETKLARGAEIDWVGVGTWDFPAQLIPVRHQEAWRITHDNLMKNNPAVFNGLRWQYKINETLRLIQMVPIATFKKMISTPDIHTDDAIRALILAYHTQMREAYADYERSERELEKLESQETDPVKVLEHREKLGNLIAEKQRISEVMAFLARFIGRWLVGPSLTGPTPQGPLPTGPQAAESGNGG